MIAKYLKQVSSRQDLSQADAYECMTKILQGKADDIQLASFLSSLHMKGVTADELTGFALAMRQLGVRVKVSSSPVVDTCGTGGDSFKTFNVSTAAAIIAASSGVTVAKHGNRSITSKCGGIDILDALGVNVDCDAQKVVNSLEDVGMGFMNAPIFHPAMKNVTPIRRRMGIPTVFNLLGPLCSPARAEIHLMGVFDPSLVPLMAIVLRNLGVEKAMVVHGFDENDKPAMDEISTLGRTKVAFLEGSDITEAEIYPEDFGIERASKDDIRAPDTLDEQLKIIKKILCGRVDNKADEKRLELSLVNAAAILFLTGAGENLRSGFEIARKNVISGKSLQKLKEVIRASQA